MRALVVPFVLFLAACEEPAADPAYDDTGFVRMGKPKPGEWLARFKEHDLTFEQYRARRPVRTTETRKVLVFLPVGPFSDRDKPILHASVDFARIWFGLSTRVLGGAPLPKSGWSRERSGGRVQYKTAYFLDELLPKKLPKDAVCMFGVTMADLYPEESWNFVFGQASLRRRVGVWSFARHAPSFYGQEETKDTPALRLRRACKLVVHEAGHAFSLPHCVRYHCTMNGSNSLRESDSRPLRLCPPCLRKLQWNRGFDVVARYKRLLAFFKRHGLAPEAEWTAARIGRIEAK